MAHPHHMHREHQVSHRRVDKILEEHGPEAKTHAKGNAFSKVTSKTAAENHDRYACGGSAPKRFARGGKVKHGKGHQTNVAIVMPHHPASGPTPPMAAGQPGGLPPSPMAGGPPPLPMGAGPPGMPPPGGPPGMPMRARGGAIKKAKGGGIDGELDRVFGLDALVGRGMGFAVVAFVAHAGGNFLHGRTTSGQAPKGHSRRFSTRGRQFRQPDHRASRSGVTGKSSRFLLKLKTGCAEVRTPSRGRAARLQTVSACSPVEIDP